MTAKPMTFAAHLSELRWRLLVSIGALAVGLAIGWFMQEPITRALIKPLGEQLYYSNPTGALDYLMNLSLFAGVIVALPVIIYHFLRFIEPAANRRFAHRGSRILLASILLAAAGAGFAYFVSLPGALRFLKSFDALNVHPLISAREYLTFVMTYIAAFAAIFQLPLIIGFINRIRPMKPKQLFGKQRWVILSSFVVAAFATPTPDPINQTIMALPLITLFNLSIVIIWLQNRKRQQPVAVPTSRTIEDEEVQDIVVRVEELAPRIRVAPSLDSLPNLRHVTDPTLLYARDAQGLHRRLVSDVLPATRLV